MKTSEEIAELAYNSGRQGQSWEFFQCTDDVQSFCDHHTTNDYTDDVAEWRSRYDAGQVEYLKSHGWVLRWTTAPEDYDTFGTFTVAEGGDLYFGKPVRQVLIDPRHEQYQCDRYNSGLHCAAEKDPRILQAEIAEGIRREEAQRKEREEKRAAGLEWLKTCTDEELEILISNDNNPAVSWIDAKAERQRREDIEADKARAEKWERCRATVKDGVVIVDDGYGAERLPHVYYGAFIMGPEDADQAEVCFTDHGRWRPKLSYVCEQLERGWLRVADPSTVPPQPVLDRFGHHRLKEIKRVEAAGRVVWVGWDPGIFKRMVLDETGRLVRAKAVVAAALIAASNKST